jgi:hypothetical protein
VKKREVISAGESEAAVETRAGGGGTKTQIAKV